MNHGPLIFLGVLFTVAASWFSLVVGPHLQFGDQPMVTIEETGREYPLARTGEARQGAEVYRANGCYYCHTQQVRPAGDGADLERKWGRRHSVARDYLRDQPVMLGSLRLGPDLANLGTRETNAHTLLLKLYNPRIVLPGSSMPRYPFLFDVRPIQRGQTASPDALSLPKNFAPPAGYEVVPRPAALTLVSYLQSLQTEPFFYEVFPPLSPKRGTNLTTTAAAATNAPAATVTATNLPAAK